MMATPDTTNRTIRIQLIEDNVIEFTLGSTADVKRLMKEICGSGKSSTQRLFYLHDAASDKIWVINLQHIICVTPK
jgi:hypothetical protein